MRIQSLAEGPSRLVEETVECPDCAGQRAHCRCCGLPVDWCERGFGTELVSTECTCCGGLGDVEVVS